MGSLDALFAGLVDDAAVFPPGNAAVPDAVRAHLVHQSAWYAPLIGPLVLPDTELVTASRTARSLAPDSESLPISVVITSGAGGLTALARRALPGLQVVAAEIALRDPAELRGNAQRVVAAAQDFDPEDVTIFVELPFQPGWVAAIEVIEAAGLSGKIRTGGVAPDAYPSAGQLADQLSELIEADLPFKATAGLHRAWPNQALNAQGETLHQHGFLTMLMAIEALVDGAGTDQAAELLRLNDPGRIYAAFEDWDDATSARVRRRFRSFGCCGVTDPVQDLVTLGLLDEPEPAGSGTVPGTDTAGSETAR
ncbi:MAG: hypothetical protein QM650_03140 [Microlunatus sp.]